MLRFAVILITCVAVGLLAVESGILAVTLLPWLASSAMVCLVVDGRRTVLWAAVTSASIVVWRGTDHVAVHGKSIPAGELLRIDGHVQDVWIGKNGSTVLVEGILDTKHLPPIDGRVIIKCRSRSLCVGDRLITSAVCVREDSTSTFRRSQGALCTVRATTVSVCPANVSARQWLTQRRSDVHDLIGQYLSEDTRSIAAALVTGDARTIEKSDRDNFIRSGTAHMFSVSGSHVAVIFAIIFLLTSWLGRSWWRVIICIVTLLTFVMFTGASDAAVRAGIMGSLWLVSRQLERSADGLDFLAAAIVAMVIINPMTIFSVGATLSVAATSSIILLTPRWIDLFTRLTVRRRPVLNTLHSSIAVSMAATTGVTIPSAVIFSLVVPLSPLTNIVVVPLLTFAMIAVLIVMMFAVVFPPLAVVAAWTADESIRLATTMTSVMAETTPDLDDTFTRMSVALVLTLLSTWPLISTTWTSLIVRCSLCVVVVTIITMFAP